VHSKGMIAKLGGQAITLVVGLIFLDLLIASVLLYRRSFNESITEASAYIDLTLGSSTLALVSVITVLGSRWGG
jgi:hypothetical protein